MAPEYGTTARKGLRLLISVSDMQTFIYAVGLPYIGGPTVRRKKTNLIPRFLAQNPHEISGLLSNGHEGLLREAPCPPTLWLEATEMDARFCMERLWHTDSQGVRILSPNLRCAHRYRFQVCALAHSLTLADSPQLV